MFHRVKELQFNARVSKPDIRFAKLLLEQFTVQKVNKWLSAERKSEVDDASVPDHGVMSWSVYEEVKS